MSATRPAPTDRPLPERVDGFRTLGIDPGLNTTGYAVIEPRSGRIELVEAGIIRGRQRGSLGGRLKEIYEGICDVILAFKPAAMSVEELYSHYERPRTAILMGHARGVICLAAANHQMTIHSYAATQVKRLLTGSGRAPKGQMQNAICREFGLAAPPEPPDVADAMAIALCHVYMSRRTSKLETQNSKLSLDH
jgi:crossover junction endodeoxyribonuclease RuvC